MKRLLGIVNIDGKEQLFVSSGTFVGFVDSSQSKDFKAYDWQKGLIKAKETRDELFNFRLGPSAGALFESVVFNIYTYGERMKEVYIDNTYKSRFIEDKMINKDVFEALKLSEQICASFSFSHSCAFSRAVEEAFGITPDDNTKIMRLILLEVERIFNHIFVISRLSGAAAQKVFTNHLIYLFDEILSLNKTFFGSRFLKNINTIGTIKVISKDKMEEFVKKLDDIVKEFSKLYQFSLKSYNYLDRLHNTGILTMEDFESINFDGPALKAIGTSLDTRVYEELLEGFDSIVHEGGDSLSRMIVRAEEIMQSMELIKKLFQKLKTSNNKTNIKIEKDNQKRTAIGFAESPSGAIYYYIELLGDKIKYVYISTPSMFLIKAIEASLVGQIFTDFAFTIDSFGAFFADAAK
jgi:Ni,Fe-hydrogenase III large subunit